MKPIRRFFLLLLAPLLFLCPVGTLVGQAIFDLGKGAYLRCDYLLAMQEWKPLAEKGDPAAQLEIGLMYWLGQGVPQNRTEGGAWLRKAALAADKWQSKAEAGDVASQLRLGLLYWKGQGVPKDPSKALSWLLKAAEGGSADAQGWLRDVYLEGEIVPKDDAEALKWLRRSAENGSIEAEANLGVSYLLGQGANRDYSAAMHLLMRSADQGNLAAAWALGVAYRDGLGVQQSNGEALKYFHKSAEQGYRRGMVALGVAYNNGFVVRAPVPEDYSIALKWFRMAAEQGDGEAEVWIGSLYMSGHGVSQDYHQAAEWLHKAVDHGFWNAEVGLGVLYEGGNGVLQDNLLAFKYYEDAANRGDHNGQALLGKMYAEGKGVTKDQVLAYMWFNLAALDTRENSAKIARQYRDALASTMTPIQVSQAQELSRSWKPNASPKGDFNATEPERRNQTTENQLTSTGTGFAVSAGHLLTNYHVVEGCVQVRVPELSGTSPVAIAATDSQNDLALLRLVTPSASTAVFRANDAPKLGQEVIAVGYPLRGLLASSISITTGTVSALAGIGNDARMVQITAPVQPGNSGGPLLDQAGNILGIVSSKLDAMKVAAAIGDIPQNINFAIKGSVARTFLDANGVEYQKSLSTAKLDPTVIADHAREFTLVVECWK